MVLAPKHVERVEARRDRGAGDQGGREVLQALKLGERGRVARSTARERDVHAAAALARSPVGVVVALEHPAQPVEALAAHRVLQGDEQRLDGRADRQRVCALEAVIPVPDSGRIAALGLSSALGVPYREGFVKNRYIGRTFIMPGQKIRKDSVRKKLNTISEEFNGKTVLIVDDSIVRGNTSRRIVQMARDAGASRVLFASSSPPIVHPNVYGIDMPAKEEYVAYGKTNDEIRQAIGADWLIYQDLGDLVDACTGMSGSQIAEFDCSCFNGIYVTGGITEEYLSRISRTRSDSSKEQASV